MPNRNPPQRGLKTSKRTAHKPRIPSEAASPAIADGPTASALDRLIEGAEYKQHPFGSVWQRFDMMSFSELVRDVGQRGLDNPILLYQEMVLDGWHRYLACLQTNTEPKLVEFTGSDLEAAEKVHASGIRRHATEEQKYASFTLLCDECPQFKAKFEQMKETGAAQRQAGKPLSTGGQRVDVMQAKADAAGVSRSTAAKVEKVKKLKPKVVAQIAAGQTSANKELKKLTGGNGVARTRATKPKQMKGDEGDARAVATKVTEDDNEVGSPLAANTPEAQATPEPLLTGLVKIGSGLADFLKNLDQVNWATEDQAKWGEAVLAIGHAAARLSEMMEAGFKGVEQIEMRAASGEQMAGENPAQVSVAAV